MVIVIEVGKITDSTNVPKKHAFEKNKQISSKASENSYKPQLHKQEKKKTPTDSYYSTQSALGFPLSSIQSEAEQWCHHALAVGRFLCLVTWHDLFPVWTNTLTQLPTDNTDYNKLLPPTEMSAFTGPKENRWGERVTITLPLFWLIFV